MQGREIVQLIQVADCERRLSLARGGVELNAENLQRLGLKSESLSEFALTRGQYFEGGLLKDDALKLRALYQEAGLEIAGGTVDCAGSDVHLRQEASLQACRVSSGLILHPLFACQIGGVEVRVEPDYLVWLDGWRVGEIKAYNHEGGLTNAFKVGSAAAQAAVGHEAMRQAGFKAAGDFIDLIFMIPREMEPKIPVKGKREAIDIQSELRALARLDRHMQTVNPLEIEKMEQAPITPCAACSSACGLWQNCQASLQIENHVWGIAPDIAEDPKQTIEELSRDPQVAWALGRIKGL